MRLSHSMKYCLAKMPVCFFMLAVFVIAGCAQGGDTVQHQVVNTAKPGNSKVVSVPRSPNAPSLPKAACCKGAPSRMRVLSAGK
ncbi:hypothetical protein [Hufsiella ginkgonis]|uniref:Uncharacterized protein n=1 Tax=Hufsiella ginkgonis TaxID=2695274 RepID=A0A7K1XXF0_9SPHI|nr:hypothetical protein [Hufsiella ginkgonis]MXV15613.1 hypothetical protein [Hufsiella ginkgonis]